MVIRAHAIARHCAVLAGFAAAERPSVLELLPHQAEGAAVLAARLRRWRCAVLADPVGSGKSYTALGTAELFGGSLTLVCPAVLVPQWRELLARSGLSGEVISDGLLSRRPVKSNMEGLVIVDEGHRFRNTNTCRRASLLGLVRYRPILWLSATPVWNSRRDLLALIRVSVGPELFVDALGAPFSSAWESVDSRDDVWNCVCERFVFRRDVTRSATRTMTESTALTVPEALSSEVTRIAHQSMVFDGEPGELFRRGVARALASSSEAAVAMLDRARLFLVRLREAQQTGGTLSRKEFLVAFGWDAVAAQCVLPFWFQPGEVRIPGLQRVIDGLERTLTGLRGFPFLQSEKRKTLVEFLESAGSTLIFTEYQATADAIAVSLPRRFRPALLTGARSAIPGIGSVERGTLLRAFVEGSPALSERLRTLIMTPLGAEGLNLQSADTVVHADLPWSQARLEQRVGRADRIGGHSSLRVLTFQPPSTLEGVCRVRETVERKEQLSPVPPSLMLDASAPVGRALPSASIRIDAQTSLECGSGRLIARRRGDVVPVGPIVERLRGSFVRTGVATEGGGAPPRRFSGRLTERTVALVRAGRSADASWWLECLDLVFGETGDAGVAAFEAGFMPPGPWGPLADTPK